MGYVATPDGRRYAFYCPPPKDQEARTYSAEPNSLRVIRASGTIAASLLRYVFAIDK